MIQSTLFLARGSHWEWTTWACVAQLCWSSHLGRNRRSSVVNSHKGGFAHVDMLCCFIFFRGCKASNCSKHCFFRDRHMKHVLKAAWLWLDGDVSWSGNRPRSGHCKWLNAELGAPSGGKTLGLLRYGRKGHARRNGLLWAGEKKKLNRWSWRVFTWFLGGL